jgi:hypothetical protein
MDESPFAQPRWFGDSRLQAGITRFQSQRIKTREPWAGVAVAGAIFGNHGIGVAPGFCADL